MTTQEIKQLFVASSSFKSTVLKALGGLMIMLLTTTISLAIYSDKEWLVILLAIFDGVAFICFIISYMHCLFKNPSLLRSERHTEQMTALEKGYLFGDTNSGTTIIKLGDNDQKQIGSKSSV